MKEVKNDLEKLIYSIDELISMEVGINYLEDSSMPDLVLTSTFNNEEGLKIYATHKNHVNVVNKIKPMVVSRAVIDYKLE